MDMIVGKSNAIQKTKQIALQIAESDSPVLLIGETGVGKELFADFIQSNSHRKNAAFVKVNCAAIQDSLLESDLFGHEKGAFTGAAAKKVGKLQLATKGTIFLDEVSNMSLAMQAKLLRAIEYQQFELVGGTKTIRVDIRIISASNRNMDKLIKREQFRKDLFFRLGVFNIVIPPLRERGTDIDDLADHFTTIYKNKYKKTISHIDARAIKTLHNYDWPGNVRELKNVIERAVLLCDNSSSIKEEHLFIKDDLKTATEDSDYHINNLVSTLHNNGYRTKMQEGISQIEKSWIYRALLDNNFVQKTAAKDLGIPARVLGYKMQYHNINCRSPYGSSKSNKPRRIKKKHQNAST